MQAENADQRFADAFLDTHAVGRFQLVISGAATLFTDLPAHSQEELQAACDHALADARQRGGNHVTLASIRFDPA